MKNSRAGGIHRRPGDESPRADGISPIPGSRFDYRPPDRGSGEQSAHRRFQPALASSLAAGENGLRLPRQPLDTQSYEEISRTRRLGSDLLRLGPPNVGAVARQRRNGKRNGARPIGGGNEY